MEMWKHRLISNFDYLMILNKEAGRSLINLSEYYVFPWVLSDYTSSSIDLNSPAVYRDLSKPMGYLNEERWKEVGLVPSVNCRSRRGGRR